ncbi:FAD-dependent oxidoreductase [Chitiniphilus purpureus]|uniref:FAD-dependent oxidoreductase n=1 Tax=Chitiniphilus purpureus TaxID=2981137 RepID=A0ABY6DIV5_9NEIS|nr:NAD(P)-binding protein [Chitiniphilus sp. CD1]UXY13967.1 FAD-dependent oxidoreductase [Chitiniphilus sp. CD1]
MSQTQQQIAVIGGGISGLSCAYYLMQRARAQGQAVAITIYERKRTLGGNAETVVVDLGTRYGDKTPGTAYLRWADLGVNDVNLTAYKLLRTMMADVGYLQQLKPLQNTESYWSGDGRVALTDDTEMQYGVSDPRFNLQLADQGLLAPLIQVVHRAALDLVADPSLPLDYTVGRYFQDCIDDPRGMLHRAAEETGIAIDWTDPALPQRLAQVRDAIYYPRISAMYFTDDRGPHTMPLQAPFNYYRIQEGGDGAPDRRYFDHGSQTWLEHLADWLVAHSDAQVSVRIRTQAHVTVTLSAQQAVLQVAGEAPVAVDWCILATHADDAREVLRWQARLPGLADAVDETLAMVRYTTSYAVCHTDANCLPDNRSIWRTYNIPVRAVGDTFFPYQIHYVVNLHQNDPLNPGYDHAGLPQYFVSLTDDLNRIPRQAMLDRVQQAARIAPPLLDALPRATRDALGGVPTDGGYRHLLAAVPPELHDKAWTVFKHNVLDAHCIEAQQRIAQFNGEMAGAVVAGRRPPYPLLFGGGWTHGAGLHEQCLEQSLQLAAWVLPGQHIAG